MVRGHFIWSGRGGRSQATLRECIPETYVVSDHPVCAASVASRHFRTGAAILLGGEGIIRLTEDRAYKAVSEAIHHANPCCRRRNQSGQCVEGGS
jgi:hypothetical protein